MPTRVARHLGQAVGMNVDSLRYFTRKSAAKLLSRAPQNPQAQGAVFWGEWCRSTAALSPSKSDEHFLASPSWTCCLVSDRAAIAPPGWLLADGCGCC